jgi:hypothetical protein
MKFQIGQKVGCIFDNSAPREILEAVPNRGSWKMPHYRFISKDSKSGFVWTPEWMLK